MTDPAARRKLRVATYNLHGGVGADGRRDDARFARVIAGLRADVIGLQEVAGSDQLRLLAEMTGLQAVPGEVDPTNALLTRLPLRDVAHHMLGNGAGALEVEVAVNGAAVRLVTTHFSHRRRRRRGQLATLRQHLDTCTAEMLVLAGDLNEWRPWALDHNALVRSFGGAPSARTYPAGLPLLRFDRILVRPRGALLRVVREDRAETRKASDHLPLWGEINTTG